MTTTFLNIRPVIFGNVLISFVAFLLFSCQPVIYLKMRTNDSKITSKKENEKEFLVLEQEPIRLRLYSKIFQRDIKREKKGSHIVVNFWLLSKQDLKVNFGKTLLIDKAGKNYPPHRDIDKDDFYEKNKEYELGIGFVTGSSDSLINLPATLRFPPFIIAGKGDTLRLPEIILE